MIIIIIPNNNIEERKYILEVIFHDFLGLEYILKIGSNDYEIVLPNQKKLSIKDTFFNKYPKDLEYLKFENIPKSIKELDVFAASFFMLTRWEEYVNKNRDIHNRFPASESLAYKEGFLDRPIVNELTEELKAKLLELDSSLKFEEKKFELVLTHDVDEVRFWKSKKQLLRIMMGDILKRKDINLAFNRIKEYYRVAKGNIKDPYDTFNWLIDQSESIGAKSRFYFMSGGVTRYDNRYDIKQQKQLIEHIKNRGHIIGIHPSYNTYNNFEQFKKEKELLEKVCECKIDEGREHYLRFEVPTTWQIWEDNDMNIDSTCGYADREGFRCGTGDEFSVFNILNREKLALKERPLIFMDGRDFHCGGFTDSTQFNHNLFLYMKQAKEYNMKLTILFHNSIFTKDERYLKEFNKVIKNVWN